ncbi:cupredoxin family copper-binding protein [Kaistella flava (ex Peng et al. 2021)]|nr:cupredoxin family copper-binding protein [Kaistella flava (ex Peng et al. 2021)]
MISLKNFFRIGFSLFAMVCLLNITSCNSGSKDTMPAENDNSSATTSSPDVTVATPPVDTAMTAKTGATAATPSTNPNAETHVVTIENMKYNPATITVKKGDQVTFNNKDIVEHNATEVNKAWASPMLQPGQSWTFTPEKTSDYYCTIHLVMKGKIIVK